MRYYNEYVDEINIAYIGGGSRGWAWGLMSDLANESAISGTVRLYDIDYEAAKHNEIIGNSLKGREDVKGRWEYKAVETLKEALSEADFIIISILPGTFQEMESDVHAPEKYGIYQSVGDTVGPGGIMRGLRTIPMYIEIANAIKNYSPNAWVINYTNPMSLCMKTLYEIFPEIKAFGCCHEVFGTQKLLANVVEEMKGVEKVKREDIKINVLGINHFTWIDKATYKGIDIMPLYKEFVNKYYHDGYTKNKDDNWINNSFDCAQRVKFDLFKNFGLIAAAGDRHLAEFVPGGWYLKNPECIKKWKFSLTAVQWRKEDLKKRLEKSKRLIEGTEEFQLNETGEEGIKQIKALLGLEDLVTNVNVPNKGQIKNLPMGAIVETNALFRKDLVLPIVAGNIPLEISSIICRHIYNINSEIEAILKEDKELAFTAFINDPLLGGCSLEEARALFEEMLSNIKEYLPEKFFI